MEKLLNPWKSKEDRPVYFEVNSFRIKEPIYQNRDFRMWQQMSACYIISWKNIAITQLAGNRMDILEAIASRIRPEGSDGFIYDRALDTMERCREFIDPDCNLCDNTGAIDCIHCDATGSNPDGSENACIDCRGERVHDCPECQGFNRPSEQ